MRYVVTAQEMRALDAATIDDLGLPGAILMETAGRRVAEVLLDEWIRGGEHVAVVCGAGNNGGDGYVVARVLREHEVDAVVYLAADEDKLGGDARLHFDVLRAMGGKVVSIANASALAEHAPAIEGADIAVDAVFGTGLGREVTGHYRAVIETINRCRGRRMAIDIPSGLSADTGAALGVAVDAHCTVTMAFLKVGLAVSPGFARAGDVRVAEIGIPTGLAKEHGVRTWMIEARDLARLVPRPSDTEHKNRRGHVLAVAGSPGKRGAGRLLSWAALRCGAGLVTLASPWTHGEVHAPDPIMTAELDADAAADAHPGGDALAALAALCEGKQALAMGPGMPTSPAAKAMVHRALAELDVPMVLDADALNHIGTELHRVAAARAQVIMTPHPGEAARLLGCSAGDVQADRLDAVRRLAEQSRAVVVLKGARTVICDGTGGSGNDSGNGSGNDSGNGSGGQGQPVEGNDSGNGTGDSGNDSGGQGQPVEGQPLEVSINPTGGAALATAGTGDVLTGVIAALLAQGLAAIDAARLGTYIHGRAGQLAAEALGTRSVTSADLADFLPRALAELEHTMAR